MFGLKKALVGTGATFAVLSVATVSWGGQYLGAQTVGDSLGSYGLRALNTDKTSNVDDDQWKKIIEDNKGKTGDFLSGVFSSGNNDMTRKIQEAKEECWGRLNTGKFSDFYTEAFEIVKKYCSVSAK